MPEFPRLPIVTPPGKPSFPELPIVTPDPPRKSQVEKYGGLYYLGIAGLILSVVLVGTFFLGLWKTRDLWAGIAALNSPARPEPDRIRAAWAVAHHPSANDRQRMDLALRKDLPPLARYILAEGLTSDAIRADPKGYALMVARSEGWPDWLRLLLARPMAYGVGQGYRIPWEPLDQLRAHKDPALALWATYTRSVMAPGDPVAREALARAAGRDDPPAPLAALLDAAARAEGEARTRKLDEATEWLRAHHPEAAEVWKGWEVRDGKPIETEGRSPDQ